VVGFTHSIDRVAGVLVASLGYLGRYSLYSIIIAIIQLSFSLYILLPAYTLGELGVFTGFIVFNLLRLIITYTTLLKSVRILALYYHGAQFLLPLNIIKWHIFVLFAGIVLPILFLLKYGFYTVMEFTILGVLGETIYYLRLIQTFKLKGFSRIILLNIFIFASILAVTLVKQLRPILYTLELVKSIQLYVVVFLNTREVLEEKILSYTTSSY